MLSKLVIEGKDLSMKALAEAAQNPETRFELSARSKEEMMKSRKYIEKRIGAGEVMYGVNTGFGAFSSVRISDDEIELLQKNLIRSHSSGVGPAFSKTQSRAMMILRANALARGHSGCRPLVVEKILEFLNHNIVPVIPSQGSVGASGDLAPLSHLALALIGEGEVWDADEKPIPVEKILKEKKMQPLELQAKEGLSLINGCQVMTAVGLLTLQETYDLLLMADLAGSMSLEGLKGSRSAFDPLISATRAHVGESMTAANLRKILSSTSEIADSHKECNRVQDAYSLRCMPAVHGAAKDTFRYVLKILETEANSSTDNPLVFADDNKILSCGNFHGEPVAFALDFLGIALASTASISECRIAKLINPAMSDLPAFLTPNGGLNSGHMIVQVAAASLVSENKILAHPASVDSIPTSAEKEDHVSMGTIAARKANQILQNAQNVIAMEMLSATQAIDLLRPLKSSPTIEAIHQHIRKTVPFAKEDRVFAKDIEAIKMLMLDGSLKKILLSQVGDLQC
ncbi:MAG: histidine ammonia-lyase [Bdellovibrionota bacterium]